MTSKRTEWKRTMDEVRAVDVMKDEVKRLENQIDCMMQEARARKRGRAAV